MGLSLKKRKKGGVELSLKEIIGLLLALGAIVVLVGLIFVASTLLFSKPEQGSTESLNNLNEAINTMINLPNNDVECYMPLYIQAGYAIVGYDFGSSKATDPCKHGSESLGEHTQLDKPTQCGLQSCICLCNAGWGNLGEKDCLKNNGCYNYPTERLELIRSEPEAAGMTDSMVLHGSSCALGADYGITNVLLTKKGKIIKIRRVDNTMGAQPCEVLKYK